LIPIPDSSGLEMSYELDVVFSRNPVVLAAGAAAEHVYLAEIVGSVKTTSKDRIDKVFLDKFLLSKLLGRDVPVVAVFLHDVQRAARAGSIYGITSTFKKGHFLGYTTALTKLDGVYYIDPRAEMLDNPKLAEQIKDFRHFLAVDLWRLSAPSGAGFAEPLESP
jgi:hypothetical protein